MQVGDDARASCMRDRVHPVHGRVPDKASASRRHEKRDAGPNGLSDADEPGLEALDTPQRHTSTMHGSHLL